MGVVTSGVPGGNAKSPAAGNNLGTGGREVSQKREEDSLLASEARHAKRWKQRREGGANKDYLIGTRIKGGTAGFVGIRAR